MGLNLFGLLSYHISQEIILNNNNINNIINIFTIIYNNNINNNNNENNEKIILNILKSLKLFFLSFSQESILLSFENLNDFIFFWFI